MADTVITITIPEAQWPTVQAAFKGVDDTGEPITIDAAYMKTKLTNILIERVKKYDQQKQAVTYSTFSPS